MSDNKFLAIKIIGYGLSIVYGLGLLVSLVAPQKHILLFWLLYFPQFVGFLAVARLKEWGRKLVVGMNVLMCLYILYEALVVARGVQPLAVAAFCISVAIILFFTRFETRVKFRTDIKSRNISILVIDDDRTLLRMVRAILMTHGFEALSANTGEKGLKLALKRQPRLIILDVILPGIKGREVCLKLKENSRTRDIPVVFLTAKDSPDDIRAEMEAGGTTHLTKPLEPQKLLEVINKILG
jgi:CheY-like chemotaxis protein